MLYKNKQEVIQSKTNCTQINALSNLYALHFLLVSQYMYSVKKAFHKDMNFHTESNFHSARKEEIIPEYNH